MRLASQVPALEQVCAVSVRWSRQNVLRGGGRLVGVHREGDGEKEMGDANEGLEQSIKEHTLDRIHSGRGGSRDGCRC